MDKRTCTIEGCADPARARGWCKKHYERWRKHGDPAWVRPQRACSAEGCSDPARSREWCDVHYMRWRRTGDANQPPKYIVRDNETRYWSKVDKRGPNECWPWIGGRSRLGYGIFSFREDGEDWQQPAGRWLLGYLRGTPLEQGEEACHHCDNPPCVNPAHLYVGSHADNMRDLRSRKPLPACPRGHPCETCAEERAVRDAERKSDMEVSARELAGMDLTLRWRSGVSPGSD